MYKIQLLNKISPAGLALLDSKRYSCAEEMDAPDGIILRSYKMHDMEIPPSVKGIARAGAGVNNIPVDRCSQQGIVVFNTPGANANAVKELTIAALLMSARKIYPAINWAQGLRGEPDIPALVEKGKSKFVGPELRGKTLGVIGLGAIGIMVCNTARHFGMEVIGFDPYLSVDAALKLSRSVKAASSMQEIYAQSDFITLHVPLTKDTKGMINSQSINSMKHGVRILNFSRGELVENEDIIAAVEEKQVYCYLTDFPNEQLLGHYGIITLPHLGATTPESEINCAEMAAGELRDFLETGNIRNSVNLPDVEVPYDPAKPRLTLFHENIPNMITGITTAVTGCNIHHLTNKSKGDYAYTVMDMDQVVNGEIMDRLKNIEGVIRVTQV